MAIHAHSQIKNKETFDNMAIPTPKPKKGKSHPSGDDRYLALDRTMKRFKFEKDALLEVLNSAQEVFGFLSKDLLIYIANQLHVPMSQVYGVATFYHMFSFKPKGEHNCIVCKGTACHVKGADQIIETLEDDFHISVGETTPDGGFSLSIARCLGSCGLAPMIVIDGQVYGKETPETTSTRVLKALSKSKEIKQ
jgi:bidirectional [NiFe] hydrogenase diaphorase subunit